MSDRTPLQEAAAVMLTAEYRYANELLIDQGFHRVGDKTWKREDGMSVHIHEVHHGVGGAAVRLLIDKFVLASELERPGTRVELERVLMAFLKDGLEDES